MTKEEIKQHKKATALNKIRKLYHPLNTNLGFTYYPNEGSMMEQRDERVQLIIENLEKELKELKIKE